MNSESVDLIYLDPPFNSDANYAAPIGSKAAGAEFKDTWTLQDVDITWLDLIEQKHPALNRVIHATMTKSDKSYLIYMAVRLLEMHRILKRTGSIYLHCDPTMSHSLKLLMDAIMGKSAFINEIIVQKMLGKGNDATRRLPRNHDVILAYGKGRWTWNGCYKPYDMKNLDEKTKKQYNKFDEDGRRYQLSNIGAPQHDKGISRTYELMGVIRTWRWTKERMEREMANGRIVQTRKGNVPRYKRYLDEQKGRSFHSIWTDTLSLQGHSKEYIHYPTQKPLALLERIIKASSNEGDMVLDPFCGCATTCIAAEKLGRRWVGIDIGPKAVDLVRSRARKELTDLIISGPDIFEVITRTDIPKRTDLGKVPPYNSKQNRTKLYGQQEGNCAGCDEHFEARHLEVDHIIARKNGGTDHIENLQLLCGHCNRVKGNRGMDYLLTKLAA